jgi:hypothetical protein
MQKATPTPTKFGAYERLSFRPHSGQNVASVGSLSLQWGQNCPAGLTGAGFEGFGFTLSFAGFVGLLSARSEGLTFSIGFTDFGLRNTFLSANIPATPPTITTASMIAQGNSASGAPVPPEVGLTVPDELSLLDPYWLSPANDALTVTPVEVLTKGAV